MMSRAARLSLLLILCFATSGCGSFGKKLRNFIRGEGFAESTAPQKPLSYSDTQNYRKGEQRRYVRMTKDQFEAEAKIGAQEGSLWVMEGQRGYLFSQNIVRLVGDMLNIKLEGPARTQVETKVSVIKKLLKKIDGPTRRVAGEDSDGDKKEDKDKEKEKPAKEKSKDKDTATAKKDGEGEAGKDEESEYGIDTVPTRIVQRLADGNYRIKGSQSFMIGKREFRVIITGIVRDQDFNDEGISSQALLEPIYDVVSVKKGL